MLLTFCLHKMHQELTVCGPTRLPLSILSMIQGHSMQGHGK